jgi:ATP-dependent Clp protease ATP-binding subunit ClpA
MNRRIVGKEDAVARIARVVRVRIAQLDFRPNRPSGSFLLVGQTGVGKNELAYALAEALCGTEERVVSVDLGEIAEEADVARLGVTLVPGTKDEGVEGLLTSPVRKDPAAILLLRGLERAHSSFQTVLQQILEQGRLDDLVGPAYFNQTVIFVTTRPRRDESAGVEIGFSRPMHTPQEAVRKRLERAFSPDLLDAFNEIIELPALTPEDVRRIARYKVEAVLQRLHRKHKEITVAEGVFETVIPDEEARADGASSLNRTLEDRLFNPLARYLLEHRGQRSIRIEMEGGNLKIRG